MEVAAAVIPVAAEATSAEVAGAGADRAIPQVAGGTQGRSIRTPRRMPGAAASLHTPAERPTPRIDPSMALPPYWNHNYGNYFGHGPWNRGWWGGYAPWYAGWGLGLGLGWGVGYPYGYGDYTDYGYDVGVPMDYSGGDAGVDPSLASAEQAPALPQSAATATEDQQGALQFYSEARAAFLGGRLSQCHAARRSRRGGEPRNPKVHELLSLALFAVGNYRPAAGKAHAAMALGTIATWDDLYAHYGEAAKYTAQLRSLEKAAEENPHSAAEHFLLGYHYLMIGAHDQAKTKLAAAVKLTPGDRLASHYLTQLQSNAPLTPPQTASRPQGTPFNGI